LTTYAVGDTVRIRTDCSIADQTLRSKSGDSLPKKGQTAKERVDGLLADAVVVFVDAFGALDVRVIPRNGQVWDGPGRGVYTVEDAVDYQFKVTLGPDSPCPAAPYSWNGIPVVFFRE